MSDVLDANASIEVGIQLIAVHFFKFHHPVKYSKRALEMFNWICINLHLHRGVNDSLRILQSRRVMGFTMG